MSIDKSVPRFAEIEDWPEPPVPPMKLLFAERYRDGGTFWIAVRSSTGRTFNFFFDKFLGRLCHGRHHDAPDAAYLKKGSKIEREAFALIEQAASASSQYREVLECLEHARWWTSLPPRSPRSGAT